ncbi:MAG: cytochrome d ubiquinol oxidase subunit II, partial [Xanthomonadales bacterium]|nr:cytochrome d ubiquinol oxidase subunit II [Xanthomonadales bacterium]
MVGAFVQGVQVENGLYAGGWFDWLTPFTLLTGISLVAGYALLGACWLVIKTEGPLQERMRRLQIPLGAVVVAMIGLVSFGTVLENAMVRERWFAMGSFVFIWVIPLVTLVIAVAFFTAVRARKEFVPFLLALCLFVMSFAGLTSSLYPYLIPPGISYTEAANADVSLAFMLVGAVVLLPVILGYTAYVYWLFRGKVRAGEGYH